MNFTPVNWNSWERAEVFRHFIRDLRCVMSLTVEVDITNFLRAVKGRGLAFYPAMIWVASTAVNRRGELRMGWDSGGNPGIWDVVSPYYAQFHREDSRFAKLVTEYDPDFSAFYERFQEDQVRFASCRGFDQRELPPNTFDLSCLPWVHYKSFDMHIFDEGTYLAPVITWGRYEDDGRGRITLPLSLNIHHAAADGFHLCRFFADVEEELAKF